MRVVGWLRPGRIGVLDRGRGLLVEILLVWGPAKATVLHKFPSVYAKGIGKLL